MKIAICDDSQADAQRLIAMLDGSHTAQWFPSAEALLIEMEEAGGYFDLYLLDIFMTGMNGVELARYIRELDSEALLCFISTSEDFYREAYDCYAFQYLLKPVERGAFQELLCRASERMVRDRERTIKLVWNRKHLTLPYSRILFVTSRGHTLFIQCRDGVVEQHTGRLEDLSQQMDGNVFVRCHQSYIVNLYNVDAMNGDEFISGGQRIPISRRYARVKEQYRTLMFEDME